MLPEILIFVISLAAIIKGADWIGEIAIEMARRLGVSELVVGATIVSLATTLPEASVSFFGGTSREPGISFGTVLASPIANLGLALGIIFLFSQGRPQKGYFSRTFNILIFLTLLILILGFGGEITRVQSFLLLTIGIVYLFLEFSVTKSELSILNQIETRFNKIRSFIDHEDGVEDLIFFVVAAIILGVGAKYLVDSAVVLASDFGISPILIAALPIAVGTSIPEIATTIRSIIKGHMMLSVGNLTGASILDLTIALGVGGIFHPIAVGRGFLIISTLTLFAISGLGLAAIFSKTSLSKIGVGLILCFIIFAVVLTTSQLT